MNLDDAESGGEFPADPEVVRDVASLEEEHPPRRTPSGTGRASLILAIGGATLLALFLHLSYYFAGRDYPETSFGQVFVAYGLIAAGLSLLAGLILGLRAVAVAKDRGAWPVTGIMISSLSLAILIGLTALVYV